MTKKPRLTDVARLAKVSPAVVSLVVNNREDGPVKVSAATADRVRAAIKELGYIPNPVARSLARGRNKILGVFTHEQVFPVDIRSFYYPFLMGIELGAEEHGYDLLLFTSSDGSDARRRIYKDGVNRLQVADGAVLLGWSQDASEIERLMADSFPFSYVGRRDFGGAPVMYAAADYAAATKEIVHHLFDLGHEQILYLASLEGREANADRRAGFREACTELGLPLGPELSRLLVPSAVTPALIRDWLESGHTALVVEDDLLGRAILDAANLAGIPVPGAVSLAVLGDPLFYTEDTHPWTTFLIPRQEMGRHATRLLIEAIESPHPPDPRNVVLPCVFHQGSTTGPPPRRKEVRQPGSRALEATSPVQNGEKA